MATITTRAAKGSELTWVELDDNLTGLNSELITASSDVGTLQSDVSTAQSDITTLQSGQILETPGTSVVTFTTGGGTITIDTAFDTLGWLQRGSGVNLGGWLKVSAISAPTGAVSIGPIPTCADLAEGGGLRRVQIPCHSMDVGMDGMLTGLINESGTSMEIWHQTGGSLISPAPLFTSSSELFITIEYITSD